MSATLLFAETLSVECPADWTDAQCEANCDKIAELFEKVRGAMETGLAEINAELILRA